MAFTDNMFYFHGEIEFVDNKTGKVLLKKNNLIVNSGRDWVRTLILSTMENVLDTSSKSEVESSYKSKYPDNMTFTTLKFGSSDAATTAAMTDLSGDIHSAYTVTFDSSDNKKNISWSSTGNYLTMTTTIDGKMMESADIIILRELGLYIGYNSNNEEMLFSRVSFDPIPIDQDTDITLTYKVYL